MRLPATASDAERQREYEQVRERIAALLDGEDDWIAALATVVAELHGAFDHYDWTGVYRLARPDELVIGPYQGGHGCTRIRLDRGVCGAAASSRRTQRVADVATFPGHIACAATTRSEIVVPLVTANGRVLGVLDVDSDQPAAFTEVDEAQLGVIASDLAERFATQALL
ncbi:MAG: GAF domain-containing protein [Polyangiaceae bacterium]